MYDFVRGEGHEELPGIEPERLESAQGPVRKIMEINGKDVYEDGDLLFYALKSDLGLAEDYTGGLVEFEARFAHGDLYQVRRIEAGG